ncbi:MAG: VTT domain-containing protein [Fimbriimonas sp.]
MGQIIDFVLHLDKHIQHLIQDYGPQTYAILFFIIFAETGFVIFPFLPGDSLLFAVGIFCKNPGEGGYALNFWAVFFLLSFAAILGDQVNYRIGKRWGRQMFRHEHARVFKRANLEKTEAFFEKYGAKTVTIARFVPIVRAFAPFVAGMGAMPYGKFCVYSIGGAFLWVGVCTGAGFLVGEAVGDKFELAILAMVGISLIPMIFEFFRHRKNKKKRSMS